MHFASFIPVGESVSDPAKYYRNNVTATQVHLDGMRAHGVDRFVFSSTAAVFGDPQYTTIDEVHPKAPINQSGSSTWMGEQMLGEYVCAYGLKYEFMCYFNPARWAPDEEIGGCHAP